MRISRGANGFRYWKGYSANGLPCKWLPNCKNFVFSTIILLKTTKDKKIVYMLIQSCINKFKRIGSLVQSFHIWETHANSNISWLMHFSNMLFKYARADIVESKYFKTVLQYCLIKKGRRVKNLINSKW